jgi:hypothetical protein
MRSACAVGRILTKSRPGPEQSKKDGTRTISTILATCASHCGRQYFAKAPYLFNAPVGKRRGGKALLGGLDSQLSKAGELVFRSEEHLFCLCDSDLVLHWLELDARNADVETRSVDQFEKVCMDPTCVPKVKLLQSSEFICVRLQVRNRIEALRSESVTFQPKSFCLSAVFLNV